MNLNGILRVEIRWSRLLVITAFWVALAVSIIFTALLIKSCSNIHIRNDMLFIRYHFPLLLESLRYSPEEVRPFLEFNLNCMVIHVRNVIMNLDFYVIGLMFFNFNTLILLFLVYRRRKHLLYTLGIVLFIYSYLTYSYCAAATSTLQTRVLGELPAAPEDGTEIAP